MEVRELKFEKVGGYYIASFVSQGLCIIQLEREQQSIVSVLCNLDGLRPVTVQTLQNPYTPNVIFDLDILAGVEVTIKSSTEVLVGKITYGAENGGGSSMEYEFVDLGLSVKWATCNIGATKPEEAGLYFQWGDTQGWTAEQVANGEKVFDWEHYKYCDGTSSVMTKYNYSDGKQTLDKEDDGANVIIGGGARIPRNIEYMELMELDSEYIENYNGTGKSALKIYSKLDKQKYILLFDYGRIDGTSIIDSYPGYGTNGWIANNDTPAYASYMYINEYEGVVDGESLFRRFGLTIRPILPKNLNGND